MKNWATILFFAFIWTQDCDEIDFIPGDTSNDGLVSVLDIVLITNHIVGIVISIVKICQR